MHIIKTSEKVEHNYDAVTCFSRSRSSINITARLKAPACDPGLSQPGNSKISGVVSLKFQDSWRDSIPFKTSVQLITKMSTE